MPIWGPARSPMGDTRSPLEDTRCPPGVPHGAHWGSLTEPTGGHTVPIWGPARSPLGAHGAIGGPSRSRSAQPRPWAPRATAAARPYHAVHEDEAEVVLVEGVVPVLVVRHPDVAGDGRRHAGVRVPVARVGQEGALIVQQPETQRGADTSRTTSRTTSPTAARVTARRRRPAAPRPRSQRALDAAGVGLAQHLRQRFGPQHGSPRGAAGRGAGRGRGAAARGRCPV